MVKVKQMNVLLFQIPYKLPRQPEQYAVYFGPTRLSCHLPFFVMSVTGNNTNVTPECHVSYRGMALKYALGKFMDTRRFI